jgi:F0F1-type ATP synthase membrane subunit b/b'
MNNDTRSAMIESEIAELEELQLMLNQVLRDTEKVLFAYEDQVAETLTQLDKDMTELEDRQSAMEGQAHDTARAQDIAAALRA